MLQLSRQTDGHVGRSGMLVEKKLNVLTGHIQVLGTFGAYRPRDHILL